MREQQQQQINRREEVQILTNSRDFNVKSGEVCPKSNRAASSAGERRGKRLKYRFILK